MVRFRKPNTAFSGRGYETLNSTKAVLRAPLERIVRPGFEPDKAQDSQTQMRRHIYSTGGAQTSETLRDARNAACSHTETCKSQQLDKTRPSNCRRLKRLLGQLLRLPCGVKSEVSEKTDGTKQNNSNYGNHIYNSSSCVIFDSIRL